MNRMLAARRATKEAEKIAKHETDRAKGLVDIKTTEDHGGRSRQEDVKTGHRTYVGQGFFD